MAYRQLAREPKGLKVKESQRKQPSVITPFTGWNVPAYPSPTITPIAVEQVTYDREKEDFVPTGKQMLVWEYTPIARHLIERDAYFESRTGFVDGTWRVIQ